MYSVLDGDRMLRSGGGGSLEALNRLGRQLRSVLDHLGAPRGELRGQLNQSFGHFLIKIQCGRHVPSLLQRLSLLKAAVGVEKHFRSISRLCVGWSGRQNEAASEKGRIVGPHKGEITGYSLMEL